MIFLMHNSLPNFHAFKKKKCRKKRVAETREKKNMKKIPRFAHEKSPTWIESECKKQNSKWMCKTYSVYKWMLMYLYFFKTLTWFSFQVAVSFIHPGVNVNSLLWWLFRHWQRAKQWHKQCESAVVMLLLFGVLHKELLLIYFSRVIKDRVCKQ